MHIILISCVYNKYKFIQHDIVKIIISYIEIQTKPVSAYIPAAITEDGVGVPDPRETFPTSSSIIMECYNKPQATFLKRCGVINFIFQIRININC